MIENENTMSDANHPVRAQIAATIHDAIQKGLNGDETHENMMAMILVAEQCRRIAVAKYEDEIVAAGVAALANELADEKNEEDDRDPSASQAD